VTSSKRLRRKRRRFALGSRRHQQSPVSCVQMITLGNHCFRRITARRHTDPAPSTLPKLSSRSKMAKRWCTVSLTSIVLAWISSATSVDQSVAHASSAQLRNVRAPFTLPARWPLACRSTPGLSRPSTKRAKSTLRKALTSGARCTDPRCRRMRHLIVLKRMSESWSSPRSSSPMILCKCSFLVARCSVHSLSRTDRPR
jgi:hypothetical protein